MDNVKIKILINMASLGLITAWLGYSYYDWSAGDASIVALLIGNLPFLLLIFAYIGAKDSLKLSAGVLLGVVLAGILLLSAVISSANHDAQPGISGLTLWLIALIIAFLIFIAVYMVNRKAKSNQE